MQFIAQWGIYAYPGRFVEPETRYQSEPLKFEAASIRAAKAHVTKLVKADKEMATLKEDKWGFGPYPPKWDTWGEVNNYHDQPGVRYSCRLSRYESESSGKAGDYSSTSIHAKIYLYWKEKEGESH